MFGEVRPRAPTHHALEPQQRGELRELSPAMQNLKRYLMATQASLSPALFKCFDALCLPML
jgi:hypothetical protein